MNFIGRQIGLASLAIIAAGVLAFSGVFTPSVAHASAARSVHVVFKNESKFNMYLERGHLDHGVWYWKTPGMVGDWGEWMSESNGVMTGTSGWAVYRIIDFDNVDQGRVTVWWNNPYAGDNTYSYEVTTYGKYGFSMGRKGGGGENATVTFYLYQDVPVDPNSPLFD
jgi:hypothetical protein